MLHALHIICASHLYTYYNKVSPCFTIKRVWSCLLPAQVWHGGQYPPDKHNHLLISAGLPVYGCSNNGRVVRLSIVVQFPSKTRGDGGNVRAEPLCHPWGRVAYRCIDVIYVAQGYSTISNLTGSSALSRNLIIQSNSMKQTLSLLSQNETNEQNCRNTGQSSAHPVR